MKTIHLSLTRLALLAAALATAGCSTARLASKAAEFERLGITEATITGKFSSTEYKVEHTADGHRRATLDHTNAWLPRVRIVRETAAPALAPADPQR